MSDNLRLELLRSLRQRYKCELQRVKTAIVTYINNPIDTRQNPQHLDEMDTLLEKMSAVEDKLSMLNKFFPVEEPSPSH